MVKQRNSIIAPWIRETRAVPRERPSIIELLGDGATNVSFKKPNSLSMIREIPPMNPAVKTAISTIPGVKKDR